MSRGFQQHHQQLMRQQQQRRTQMGGAYVEMQRRRREQQQRQQLAQTRQLQTLRRRSVQVRPYVPPAPPSPKQLLEGHRARQPELVARLEGASAQQLAELGRRLGQEEAARVEGRDAAREALAGLRLERDLLRASTGPLAWLRGRFDDGRRAARLAAKERLGALRPRLEAAAQALLESEAELQDALDRGRVFAFWREHFAKG